MRSVPEAVALTRRERRDRLGPGPGHGPEEEAGGKDNPKGL